MRTRTTYTYVALTVVLVGAALGLAAWLVSSLNEMHERFARESRGLGLAFLIVLIILLAIGAVWLGRLAWRSRAGGASPPSTPVPADVIQAAAVQANQAEGVIRQVGNQDGQGRAGPGAGRDPGGTRTPRVPRRHLRHGLGRQDLADQCAAGPRGRQDRGDDGDDPAGREPHVFAPGRRGDRLPHRHAGPLGDRGRRGGPRAGGARAGRAGRPDDLRARPRPGPHRVRAALGPGAAGEAVDRAPEQDRPVPGGRPRRHPGEAAASASAGWSRPTT